ncbi:MAG TPA: ABC transporter ATP-binding protein [Rectinemataceae bacterium]
MIKLARYLKPYWASIVLVVSLLFIQANADLALPDFMSKIVNVGIQQGGIEDAVPQAIGSSSFDKLMGFLATDDQEILKASYTAVDQGVPGYSSLARRYPKAGEETIYTLNTAGASSRKRLEAVLAPAMVAATFARQAVAAMGEDSARAAAMLQGPMLEGMKSKIAGMDPAMIAQMGVQAVKSEYERLGMDLGKLQSGYILATGGSMLLITLLSVACVVLVGYLGSRTAAGIARDLRLDFFKKVESFSFAEFDTFSTASLITRSTNDITQIQMLVLMGVRMFFYAPIVGIGGVIRATGKASSMWWIIALAVTVILGVIATVFALALPRFKSIQKLIDKLNLVVRENLSGMMVIRAFSMQDYEEKRFDTANKNLTGTMLFINRVMVVMMPLMFFIMNVVSIVIIWIGAHEVAQAQIRVGDMMAFMQYAMQIFFSFIMLSFMFIILPRASVSAERLAEVLETKPSILDPCQPLAFDPTIPAAVEFKHVSFRYPGASEDVLHDISFRAEPGQTTAIIGTTGSGKTTLVSLIPRFYDPTEGSVTVADRDLRSVSQASLRERIGFVPQNATLFSGTIESNLRYAEESATADRMVEALEISQAKEFVDSKPEGLGLEISQGGGNVSGGQRQRLSIARALVKKAPINIFDDSFSALDFRTDAELRKAVRSKLADSVVFLVTQRVASVRQADQILVLDEGRLVGKGTHSELMETCEVYRDIALSQLKQEELA